MPPVPLGRIIAPLWRAAGLVLALSTLSFAGCGGSSEAPPEIVEATATRDSIDGDPGLTSTIIVRFARGIRLDEEEEIPLASRFEIFVPDPFDPDQSHLVLPREVRQSEEDRRVFEMGVDLIVPNGSQLRVSGRLFDEDAPDLTATIEGDIESVYALLASTSLGPADSSIYDDGAFADPTGPDSDRAAMREQLIEHLETRQSGTDVIGLALNRFDTMSEDVVPDPKLRAVLAALTGTFADAAVEQLLTEQNCLGLPAALIAFQDPPDDPELFARVTHLETGQRVVSVSPRLAGEPIELLMPLLAHEAIHCDPFASLAEEVAATAFDTLLYLQLLTAFPDLVSHRSPLSKDLAIDAIAMINSGRALPESIGILQSPAVIRAIPYTNVEYGSFLQLVGASYFGLAPASPVEPLAAAYAETFADAAGLPLSDPFDLEYLDALLAFAIDPRALLLVIATLGLEPAN
jgi:hypothetical protein